MNSAAMAVLKAIHARLINDATLTTLVAARVFDAVPARTIFPYVTFAGHVSRDASTSDSDGEEHAIILNVWSRTAGRDQAETIAAAVRGALHDQALALTGHRLINLRHEATETARDGDGESYRAAIRFRAVTAPT